MKKLNFLILILTIESSQFLYAQSYPRTENPNYMWTTLDEQFNTLSTTVWEISHNLMFDSLLIWVPGTPTVTYGGGKLYLSMHYTPDYNSTNEMGQPITADYIAGEVTTKKDFTYGIFECYANFAYDKGSFPAFWLYNDTACSLSSRPEIDIVECKVHHANPTLDNHIFYYPINCGPYQGYEFARHDFTWGAAHTFKLVWTPSKIEFWVDNTLKKTVLNTGQFWYPSLRQHLKLSQQITKYGIRIPGTDEIINPSTDPIVTPQTSSFDWVKVREYFLSPEITVPSLICSSGTAVLDVDSKASDIHYYLSPTYLFSGATEDTTKTASITKASSTNSGQGKIKYTFKMPSGEQFEAEKTFWVGKPGTPLTSPSGYPTLEISLGAFQPISLFKTPGFTGGTINWWSTGSIEPVGSTAIQPVLLKQLNLAQEIFTLQ